ncbi:MAG: flagellar basal body rod protein FlgB [Betaproteobacteria bacterium]|nr:flagellar basal body rod protein FlgB [Betaproteobacteria bacterium]
MLNPLGNVLGYHAEALKLRAERQRVLASNIANADTPNFKAVDFNFGQALQSATAHLEGAATPAGSKFTPVATDARHLGRIASTMPHVDMKFRTPSQPSIDGNTVEMDLERAAFADNAVRYEATLRFLNGQFKTMQMAVQGQ